MLKEFKKFIARGNVIDLAVGIVVGGAFSKIVSSLVDNILMPTIGLVIGGIDFSSLSVTIKDATINYGLFIQNTVDFLIIAFVIFLIVRFINKIHPKPKEEKKKAEELIVLEEIRDMLKKQKRTK
ncbi:MAG TPA: large-conductance mechanosensitive channel protein MscL [Bacilli bacterium]|nr:large-conductance mechanosensitive channel protein MscL [Bacilli bacterium]